MHVLPPCFHLADDVFPRVRAHAARRLVADGWSQARTGKALGISQAMVSKLLAAPLPRSDAVVLRLSEELHRDVTAPAHAKGASPWCATLGSEHAGPGADAAMLDILEAERTLIAANPLRLVPQIGLNVARALADAADADAVLAFPGRLVEAGGRIISPAPPAFGGSGHLARCLLVLRGKTPPTPGHTRPGPRPLALANVRGGVDVLRAAKRLGWRVAIIARSGKAPEADAEASFRRAAQQNPQVDAYHDAGDMGIEPCLYIAAADARSAAAQVLRLNETLVKP